MSRLRLIAAASLALVLALPATVLGATVDVSGTVTAPEGVSVAGVEIAVLVRGSDQIVATTTDETGGWALQVDAEPGAVLEVNATGTQTSSEPDEDGCVTLTTPNGKVEVEFTEAPLAPVEIALDSAITSERCPDPPTPTTKPTKTPRADAVAQPGTTPPATDAIGAPGPGAAGTPFVALLGLLVLTSGVSLALARRERARALVHSRAALYARRFQAHPVRRD